MASLSHGLVADLRDLPPGSLRVPARRVEVHTPPLHDPIPIQPEGRSLHLRALGNELIWWDPEQARVERRVLLTAPIQHMAASEDGAVVAVVISAGPSSYGRAWLQVFRDGKPVEVRPTPAPCRAARVGVSPDGAWLALSPGCTRSRDVSVVDLVTGDEVVLLPVRSPEVAGMVEITHLRFQPGARCLLVKVRHLFARPQLVLEWSLPSGAMLGSYPDPDPQPPWGESLSRGRARSVDQVVVGPGESRVLCLLSGTLMEVNTETGDIHELCHTRNRIVKPWLWSLGVATGSGAAFLAGGPTEWYGYALPGPEQPADSPLVRMDEAPLPTRDRGQRVLVSPDGAWRAVAPDGAGRLYLQALGDLGDPRWFPDLPDRWLYPRAFAPEGGWLAVEAGSFLEKPVVLGVVDLPGGAWKPMISTKEPFHEVRISPRGTYVALTMRDQSQVRLCLPFTEEPPVLLELDLRGVRDTVFSSDERHLLALGEDGCLHVVDLRVRHTLEVWVPPWGGVTALALDEDRDWLVLACQDGCLYQLGFSVFMEPYRRR